MTTKIVAVLNQKGGVGKTSICVHGAHAGAEMRQDARVLVLDLDSQGNASQYLTGDMDIRNNTEGGVGLFLEGKPFEPMQTTHPGIFLLHGHAELDRYDNDLHVEARGYSRGLEMQHELRSSGFDYVIIDTPPAVGFRHMVAMLWADVVVIPMEPVATSIGGFQDVIHAIDHVIHPINPNLEWYGVVNRFDPRVKSHQEKDQFVRSQYGNRILATLATRSAVSDAMEEEPARPVWHRRGAPKELREQWLTFSQKMLLG